MTSPPAASRPKAPKKHSRQDRFDGYDAFVADIVGLCARSTKAQADLRTGLGRPLERCNYMHRYLVPLLGGNPDPRWYDARRRAHYTVAALIAARPRTARDADRAAAAEALVPDTGAEADTKPDTNPDALASHEDSTGAGRPKPVDWWTRPNLGASLGEAVNKRLLKADTAEADLHLMVRQGADALQQRLPALTRHLLGGGVRIDWSVLLDDLALWDFDRDRIATRWLESYFQVRDRDDPDDPGSHDASADTPTDPPAPRKENH